MPSLAHSGAVYDICKGAYSAQEAPLQLQRTIDPASYVPMSVLSGSVTLVEFPAVGRRRGSPDVP